MPRPTPDYIPKEFQEFVAASGLTPKEFAEQKGLNPRRFYSLFGGANLTLRPYIKIADAAEISVDDLAMAITTGRFVEIIETLKEKLHCKSPSELARLLGVSDNFILKRIKTSNDLNGLAQYKEVAERIGWTLDKLCRTCHRF